MTQTTAARAGAVRLGDIEVNRLGFGAMRITGDGVWGPPEDRDDAIRVLRRALELEVQLIDTADSYGPDVSEELIAEALHPYPEGVVIATKGGLERTGPGEWPRNGRREHLREACEGSLRRLRVDQIDLYQLHSPDDKVPYEESVGAPVELKEEGKIARIGVSNVNSDQLATARGLTEVVSVQSRFNISARSNEDVLDTCTEEPSCPGSRSAQARPPRWRRTSRGTAASTPTRSVPRARVRSSDASSCPHRTAAGRES